MKYNLTTSGVMLGAILIAGCSPYKPICCGYEWWDGGSGNIAIVRNISGHKSRVVQPDVTAFESLDHYLLVERRPTNAIVCEYYLINMDNNRIERFDSINSFQHGLSRVIPQAPPAPEVLSRSGPFSRSCLRQR